MRDEKAPPIITKPQARPILEALACGRPRCPCGQAASRGQGNTHCPVPGHSDDNPSLSVGEKNGKVLVRCHAGCEQRDVIAALRERGLWSEGNCLHGPVEIVATYTYCDEAGTPTFEVCRTADKHFLQRRAGADEWGLKGVRRVLYRLPELLAADPEAQVFVCEGEKDADRLADLGLVATTSPGGAGKWRKEYAQPLRGRRIAILPDNDNPGRQHAQQIALSLQGVAQEAHVLDLPDLPEHGDVSDWLAAGGTAEGLLALAAAAPAVMRPESGAAVLNDVATFIRRFVVLAPEQIDVCALWVMHTWTIGAAQATPYLSLTSPEKRSGKTLTLEVLDLLVARPWLTGRVTAAVLVRKIDRGQPTLLLDESDAAFKSGQEYAEALRGILNSGHRRGGVASLCVKAGGDFDLRDFGTFCAKAIAGIGRLPDTVADRAIIIVLKRRQAREPIERFRWSQANADAEPLRTALATWAASNLDALEGAQPELPPALDDRAADGWEPLLAIADLVGADWPQRARLAALALSVGDSREDTSLGVRLLADVRTTFQDRDTDRLPSVELCRALNALEESPWGDIRGRALDPRGLARRLKPFGVTPGTIRLADGQTPKGYLAEWFADTWHRYLPYPEKAPQAPQAPQGPGSDSAGVADVADVAANTGIEDGGPNPGVGVCGCCGGPTAVGRERCLLCPSEDEP